MEHVELSAGSLAIAYVFAETFRLIGSSLGDLLLSM